MWTSILSAVLVLFRLVASVAGMLATKQQQDDGRALAERDQLKADRDAELAARKIDGDSASKPLADVMRPVEKYERT